MVTVKNSKIEMTFKKDEKLKEKIIAWGDVKIIETKKFYKVIVHDDSMFENYFKYLPEHITTRKLGPY